MIKNIKDKNIISREVERVETCDVVFREYTSSEDINNIEGLAEFYFNKLITGLNNSGLEEYTYSYAIESYVYKKIYYWVNYFDDIDSQIRGTHIVETLKKVNPNFCTIFESRLNELAKESMTYIEIKLLYDKEMEAHFYSLTLHSREYFENKFGVSLDTYYSSKNTGNFPFSSLTLEEQYRKAIEELKRNYIKFMVRDREMGLDSDFIFSDGFMSLLMVNCKFKELDDDCKNRILTEMDFIVDDKNGTLKLVRSK